MTGKQPKKDLTKENLNPLDCNKLDFKVVPHEIEM